MKVLIENQAKLMATISISMPPIFIECLQRIAGFHVTGNDDMPELPARPAQRRRRKRKSAVCQSPHARLNGGAGFRSQRPAPGFNPRQSKPPPPPFRDWDSAVTTRRHE